MKTVFILGAGASQMAGAPLMVDFLDRAYDLLRVKTQGIIEAKKEFEDVFKKDGHKKDAKKMGVRSTLFTNNYIQKCRQLYFFIVVRKISCKQEHCTKDRKNFR